MDNIIDFLNTELASIQVISDDWVKSVIDENFAEFEEFSTVVKLEFFDNNELVQLELLRKVNKLFQSCHDIQDTKELWAKLEENSVGGKKIGVFLWNVLEIALPKESSGNQVKCGVEAASAYLHLCSIKGSTAYKIFHPALYMKCIELFRIIYRSYTYDVKSVEMKTTKSKGKKSVKAAIDTEDEMQPSLGLDQGELRVLLDHALRCLFVILNAVGLSAFSEAGRETVLLIRDLAVTDFQKDGSVKASKDILEFDRLGRLSEKCFALMHRLSQNRHSAGSSLVLSYFVYPRLSFWTFEMGIVTSSASIPALFVQWKDSIIAFLRDRCRLGEAEEMKFLLKVLDNLYCRCPDRSDYRSKVSATVLEVLQLLPVEYQYEFIQRAHIYSRSGRNPHRSLTAEIFPLILRTLDLEALHDVHEKDGPRLNQTATARKRRNDDEGEDGEEEEQEAEKSRDEDDEEENQREKASKKDKKRQRKRDPAVIEKVEPKSILYSTLIRYCLDKSSSVRSRAIVQVTHLLSDDGHRDRLVEAAFNLLESDKRMFTGKKDSVEEGDIDESDDEPVDVLEDSDIDIKNPILHVICLAVTDTKAAVRKAGIIAMTSYMPFVESSDEFEQGLGLIKKCSVDSSVLVRKQAADSLNQLLQLDTSLRDQVEDAWLCSVMPMVNDREQSVQQASIKMIIESIVSPFSADTSEKTWNLVHKVEQQDNFKRLLLRAMYHSKSDGIYGKLVDQLQLKLSTHPEHSDVIWMLLEQIAFIYEVSPSLALRTWYTLEDGTTDNKVRYVARVMTSAIKRKHMGAAERAKLITDLQSRISECRIAAAHISSVYLCLAMAMDAIGDEALGKDDLITYGKSVLLGCRAELKKHVSDVFSEVVLNQAAGETFETIEERMIRIISTIGEVVQFSPKLLTDQGAKTKDIIDACKSIMVSQELQKDPQIQAQVINSAFPSRMPTPAPGAFSNPSSQEAAGSERPQSQAVGSEFGSQPIFSQGKFNGTQLRNLELFTPAVRAYCVLALGKFSLMDESLAKVIVPVFVKQLEVNEDHIIRNNIVVVICDLCIRYTLLVDNYSSVVAGCLRDRSTLVRHQVLESLTNLMKEQYIRWGGQIMYRFIAAVLDENTEIREYAEFCLKDVLLLQFPDLFSGHIIECLYYFNGIEKKHLITSVAEEAIQVKKFCLSGDQNMSRRMHLYKFMISTFNDREKFITFGNLCEQVLHPVLVGELRLKDQKAYAIVEDAFNIMISKEFKLKMELGKPQNEEEDEAPENVRNEAKKILADFYRLRIIDHILPTLLEMRIFLRDNRSPLLSLCIGALRTLCMDHKEKISELLASDPQLLHEIQFDIKRYEDRVIRERREKAEAAKKAALEKRRSRRSLAAATALLTQTALQDNVDDIGPNSNSNTLSDVAPASAADDDARPSTSSASAKAQSEKDDVQMNAEVTKNVEKAHSNLTRIKSEVCEDQPQIMDTDEANPISSNGSRSTPPAPAAAPLQEQPSMHRRSTRSSTRRQSLGSTNSHVDVATNIVPKTEPVDENIQAVTAIASARKRVRASSVLSVANETVYNGPVISTPNRTGAPLPDLDLSAIAGNANRRLKTKIRSKRISRPMAPIDED